VPRSSYERSKGVETITWREFPLGKAEALAILEEATASARQSRGQALLETLNRAAGLPDCRLTVADRPQQHRTRAGRLELKTYGYYRIALDHGGAGRGTIRIYNLTAIRRQVLSPKVFLETLLHEWVHHYDLPGLELDRSPHTSGFFARIRAVAETLGVGFVTPPKRELGEAIPTAAEDVLPVAGDRFRPGGVEPPRWIRDQIHSLFGRRDH